MSSSSRPSFVGMVHLEALPGSPGWRGSMDTVLTAALRDAERLLEGGCDMLLVENMGDLPWLRGSVPPWTVAAMTRAVDAIVKLGAPTGLQVLAAANREALGIAAITGAQFIRVEGFAWAHVADEGWIEACAGPLLRDRAMLGRDVAVWADVQKKHSAHAVTADVSLADLAHGTAFAGADVLIATGSSTGRPTSPDDLQAMRSGGVPVAIGSGVTPERIADLRDAHALIVGSWLKEGGDWRAPVDSGRVREIRATLDKL